MSEVFDDSFWFQLIKSASLLFLAIPPFAGISNGISMATSGICDSASISTDLMSAIAPGIFVTAPIMFSLVGFFIFRYVPVDSYDSAVKLLVNTCLVGIPGYFSSSACGSVAVCSVVTKAKQKKFIAQFFLMFIFLEVIPIFSLILSIYIWKRE